MKVCVLGSAGMLGSTLFFELSRRPDLEVWGTLRGDGEKAALLCERNHLLTGIDARDFDCLAQALRELRPQVVINAIGLIRQKPKGQDRLPCIEINSRLPHLLLALCRELGARLIHYSTDCVFDGKLGRPYREDDPCTAKDIYGLSKYLGEVSEAPALTLRTSLIGPELGSRYSLVEWFLAQKGEVNGFTQAIYSGLPTAEHARILAEVVLPDAELSGLYHLSSQPISKCELLGLIAQEYGLDTKVNPVDGVSEDKRLAADKFQARTGYAAPPWRDLVAAMHASHINLKEASHACPG